MAENAGQDKTEEPTERKLQKAREEGQLVRSRELQTTVLLLAGAGALWLGSGALWQCWVDVGRASFGFEAAALGDPYTMLGHLSAAFGNVSLVLVPILSVSMLAAIAGTPVVGGTTFAPKALLPKGSRIDPAAGFGRMFSMRSLVELGKSLAKFVLVASVSIVVLIVAAPELLRLDGAAPAVAAQSAAHIVVGGFAVLAAAMVVIAVIDVPFQMAQHKQQLRMTRQEVKDELKQSEGSPEVRGRLRRLQQQVANARMMQAVPEADVVITNPEHYAVALRYRVQVDDAPVVVAKGVDLMAQRIREVAEAHDVPLLRAPPLARAVYHHTDVGQAIPVGLYRAVAEVLAWVQSLRRYRRSGGEAPVAPRSYDIPEEFVR